MPDTLLQSLSLIQPEIAPAVTFVAAIFVEFIARSRRHLTGYFVLVGFAVTLVLLLMQGMEPKVLFSAMYVVDPFSQFFKILVLATSAVIILFPKTWLYAGNP